MKLDRWNAYNMNLLCPLSNFYTFVLNTELKHVMIFGGQSNPNQ